MVQETVLDCGKAFRGALKYRKFEVALNQLPKVFLKKKLLLKGGVLGTVFNNFKYCESFICVLSAKPHERHF